MGEKSIVSPETLNIVELMEQNGDCHLQTKLRVNE
jgi:hypothetical protein